MKSRKIIALFLTLLISITFVSCSRTEKNEIKPEIFQIKSICELSVMECYYHNVAKYNLEDAEGILLWKKDRHFWIEYKGIVKLGIDASLVSFDVKDTSVTVIIPKAKVFGQKVEPKSLTKESFVVDKILRLLKLKMKQKLSQKQRKTWF